ncbi:MAG: endolytic transglycosylase MltG [Lachnospira sp.]|nr:endolytic transglycosylase MltG [Lachnospira sp.]
MVIQVSLDVLLVVLSAFLIFWLAGKVYTFGYNIFNEQAVDTLENARVTEVTVPENVTAEKLAEIIYEKGLVTDKTIFYLQVKLSDYNDKFVAGTYTLNTAMTPTEMMKVITSDTKGK